MTEEEALKRLHAIVAGIDRCDSDDMSWWETSVGAEFGAQRLSLLEQLVSNLADAGGRDAA